MGKKHLSIILRDFKLLGRLVKNDLRSKYIGNSLGIIWAFIQPVFTILIFWFVFQVGFKSQPVGNVPFILWLVSGMVPWFFIADSLNSTTHSIIANSFLVKKIVFKVSLLPIVQLLSSVILHLCFIVFIFGMFLYYGYTPNWYWIQIVYYTFSACFILAGIAFLTSSLSVFFRDITQLVAMSVQFGFWLTPIFWSTSIIPTKYKSYIELNPMYYIVEGYRDSLINNIWLWEKPWLALYFWTISLIIFVLGVFVFKKTKLHFADVI